MRKDYQNLHGMINLVPIKVTLLKQGTFHEYKNTKRSEGLDIAFFRPRHINPSETDLDKLLEISASL